MNAECQSILYQRKHSPVICAIKITGTNYPRIQKFTDGGVVEFGRGLNLVNKRDDYKRCTGFIGDYVCLDTTGPFFLTAAQLDKNFIKVCNQAPN